MQTLDSKLEHMANIFNAQAEVSTQKLNAALSAFSSAQGTFEDKYNALLGRLWESQSTGCPGSGGWGGGGLSGDTDKYQPGR